MVYLVAWLLFGIERHFLERMTGLLVPLFDITGWSGPVGSECFPGGKKQSNRYVLVFYDVYSLYDVL